MSNSGHKLQPEHKQIIIKMLGAWETPTCIQEYLKDEYGIEIALPNISYYKKKRKEEIRESRKNFLKDVEILPVVEKQHRILLRQKLVNDLMDKLWCEHCSGTTGMVMYESGNHDVVNKLLDSIQRELEPAKVAMTDPTGEEGKDIIYNFWEMDEKAIAEFLANRVQTTRRINKGKHPKKARAL